MFMNPIKWWKERREQKRKDREAQATLQMWAWLEKIFAGGMLSFDYKANRLFMTQPMASLLMAGGADGWVRSVDNIYQYAHWLQVQHEWEQFMRKEELAAVRRALKDNPKMKREDVERVKRACRQDIAMSDLPEPKTEPFEFFIIPDSVEANVEPLAVGYYDPATGQMDVATWDEVRELVSATPNDV